MFILNDVKPLISPEVVADPETLVDPDTWVDVGLKDDRAKPFVLIRTSGSKLDASSGLDISE